MKKIKFLLSVLIVIAVMLPFTVQGENDLKWNYNSAENTLTVGNITYVKFDTYEYNVALGEQITKAESDSYYDYYVYSVKNDTENDLIFLYSSYACYDNYSSAYCCGDGNTILFCKEEKVEEYTEIIRNFTPSDNYCIGNSSNVVSELDSEIYNGFISGEKNTVKYNSEIYNDFYCNEMGISVYDENKLFYAQIGDIYSGNGYYFCDYRNVQNVGYNYGLVPQMGFLAEIDFYKVTEDGYKSYQNICDEIYEKTAQINEECTEEDSGLLVSSASVADITVMVASILLLIVVPAVIACFAIVKLICKNLSKPLWITLLITAVIVVNLTILLMVIII